VVAARNHEQNFSGAIMFQELMQTGGAKERRQLQKLQRELQSDDPINIQFTSGTTGNPKGATLSHHGILNNAYFVGEVLNYDQVLILHLYHE